jgi:hypothetical protein
MDGLRRTGLPAHDAREDFRRARRAHAAARAARWLARRHDGAAPRTLTRVRGLTRGGTRLEVIRLAAIAGTLEPAPQFDAHFRPASEHVRMRWERIALAHRRGTGLPPITVVGQADAYYVIDGKHRVSVALALGWEDIEAYVTEMAPLTLAAENCERLAA